jgi:hypothetical protein
MKSSATMAQRDTRYRAHGGDVLHIGIRGNRSKGSIMPRCIFVKISEGCHNGADSHNWRLCHLNIETARRLACRIFTILEAEELRECKVVGGKNETSN